MCLTSGPKHKMFANLMMFLAVPFQAVENH